MDVLVQAEGFEADAKTRFIGHLDASRSIAAHLLVMTEARSLAGSCSPEAFPMSCPLNYPDLRQRLDRYKQMSECLAELAAVGSFSSYGQWRRTARFAIEHIAPSQPVGQYDDVLQRAALYPALLVLYCIGVAAMAANSYDVIYEVLFNAEAYDVRVREFKPLAFFVYPEAVVEPIHIGKIWCDEPVGRSTSDHIRVTLRRLTEDLIPGERRFNYTFDRFEAFLALAHLESRRCTGLHAWEWVPHGRFIRRMGATESMWSIIRAEGELGGESWAPLRAGWFGGSFDRFREDWSAANDFMLRSGLC